MAAAGGAAAVLSLPVTVNEKALMRAISAAQALGDKGKIPVATLVITVPWQSDRELKRLNVNCFSYLFLICGGISRVNKNKFPRLFPSLLFGLLNSSLSLTQILTLDIKFRLQLLRLFNSFGLALVLFPAQCLG